MITVLYYTSNQENSDFEEKVRSSLLAACGDLPVISVSQKPINLGFNICVGEVGASGFNLFRQVLIGCRAAKTRFVVSAEADCFYPPDYFLHLPDRDDLCFRNENLYILRKGKNFFLKKPWGSVCAQIVNRNFYISTLERLFGNGPKWSMEEKQFPRERSRQKQVDVFWHDKITLYKTQNPVISVKTGHGLRNTTPSQLAEIKNIPYWGEAEAFRNKYQI